ncbi:hypothetical protein MHBO_004779, partial [Bonamia ostreae]
LSLVYETPATLASLVKASVTSDMAREEIMASAALPDFVSLSLSVPPVSDTRPGADNQTSVGDSLSLAAAGNPINFGTIQQSQLP